MSRETEWVKTVKREVARALGKSLIVETGYQLPYAFFIESYEGDLSAKPPVPVTKSQRYQTDLLIAEQHATDWVPRVVVEFKLGQVSSHDAITYSAKAATHKRVYPYLRYGIVVGAFEREAPQRLLRHGDHFDFIMTMPSEKLTEQRDRLTQLLQQEVEASRQLSALLSSKEKKIWLLHRKLELQDLPLLRPRSGQTDEQG